MKIKVQRQVVAEITVEGKDMFDMIATALWEQVKGYQEGKKRSFKYALGFLPGKTDVEAVKIGNRKSHDVLDGKAESISTAEFRKMLTQSFSSFASSIIEDNSANSDQATT